MTNHHFFDSYFMFDSDKQDVSVFYIGLIVGCRNGMNSVFIQANCR